MSQATDYIIVSAPRAEALADLNSVFGAIQSINSGSSGPSSVAAMLWADSTSSPWTIKIRDHTNSSWASLFNTNAELLVSNIVGPTVFNEAGADVDFRFEGDTEQNLLFLDAGNDRIGIGTAVPDKEIHVVKTSAHTTILIESDGGSFDPRLQFKSNADWIMGIDDGLSGDPFVISGGGSLTANPIMTLTNPGDVKVAGLFTANSDTDGLTILGRTQIGSLSGDTAALSHFDHQSLTGAGLIQFDVGTTRIGAPTGRTVGLAINGTEKVIVSSTDVITNIDSFWTGSGSGLPYADMYANDNAVTTSVSNAGFTQITIFDTNGHNNLATPDHTNDHITIVKAGVYMVDCCLTVANNAGAGHKVEIVIAKNNGTTIFANCRRHRTLASGTDVGAMPICGHIDVAANDTIEVWATSDSGAGKNITIEDITLGLVMIGGT